MSFIDVGKKEGATLEYGGKQCGSEGYFIEPTVFTDVKPEMAIVQEEIFGPGTYSSFHHHKVHSQYLCQIFSRRCSEV